MILYVFWRKYMTTIKQWILETQSPEDIQSISDNGCINGTCNELIYYDDTVEFYDNHKDEIWEMLREEAENFGYKNVFEFLGTWSNYSKDVDDDTTFKNLLAWWAVENVCYEIIFNEEVA